MANIFEDYGELKDDEVFAIKAKDDNKVKYFDFNYKEISRTLDDLNEEGEEYVMTICNFQECDKETQDETKKTKSE